MPFSRLVTRDSLYVKLCTVFLERVRFLSAVSLWKAEEVVHATCRFLALSYTFTSVDQYYHSLSVDTINDFIKQMPNHS